MSAPTAAPAIKYPETATVAPPDPKRVAIPADQFVRIRYPSHPLNGEKARLVEFRRGLTWGFAVFGDLFHVEPFHGQYPGGYWFAPERLEPCTTEVAVIMAKCQARA